MNMCRLRRGMLRVFHKYGLPTTNLVSHFNSYSISASSKTKYEITQIFLS
jgi:hypothetical protein